MKVATCCITAMDYLDFVNSLNQLMMMATQLHNDALDPRNHKYSAHQIALLYVSHSPCMRYAPLLREPPLG